MNLARENEAIRRVRDGGGVGGGSRKKRGHSDKRNFQVGDVTLASDVEPIRLQKHISETSRT